jgi:hypothetical protein
VNINTDKVYNLENCLHLSQTSLFARTVLYYERFIAHQNQSRAHISFHAFLKLFQKYIENTNGKQKSSNKDKATMLLVASSFTLHETIPDTMDAYIHDGYVYTRDMNSDVFDSLVNVEINVFDRYQIKGNVFNATGNYNHKQPTKVTIDTWNNTTMLASSWCRFYYQPHQLLEEEEEPTDKYTNFGLLNFIFRINCQYDQYVNGVEFASISQYSDLSYYTATFDDCEYVFKKLNIKKIYLMGILTNVCVKFADQHFKKMKIQKYQLKLILFHYIIIII